MEKSCVNLSIAQQMIFNMVNKTDDKAESNIGQAPLLSVSAHLQALAFPEGIDEYGGHHCHKQQDEHDGIGIEIEHDGELVRYDTIVDKILLYKEEVINNTDEIANIIKNNNITDKSIKKKHINKIKENNIDKDLSKCPKCGGQLVERNGKYGKFIGCTNYPKCKYTENINN